MRVDTVEVKPFDVTVVALNAAAAAVESAFTAAGFRRISAGEVINDYLYPELFRCGVAESDSEATTYALWLAFRFSRYLIMEKAGTTT